MKYTIIIQWSEEDKCYVVSLPDFTNVMQPCTHGETYEEAFKNAQEVLEMLVECWLNLVWLMVNLFPKHKF
jgi:predicted RNase H-like HicB family nuclease